MTADQLTALLPPIALSLGAILPFLIASPPFSVAANARILLICVMTLVIWMGYWLAYLLGEWAFYSLLLTICLIVASFVVFIIIFRAAQLPPVEKKANGAPVIGEDGKNILEAPIDRPGYLWAYICGLIFVSMAAALYVGPQGRVIIEFELPPTLSGEEIPKVDSIGRDIGGKDYVRLDPRFRTGKALCMMTKSEYARVTKFVLKVDKTPSNEKDLLQTLVGYPDEATELLKPGIVQNLRIRVRNE